MKSMKMISGACAAALLLATLAGGTAAAQPAAPRPLLVTVVDLPLAKQELHPELAEWERINRELLAALEKHRIQAVRFVAWDRFADQPDQRLLDLWQAAGHELGNNSSDYLDYSRTGIPAYLDDVEDAREGLAAYLEPKGKKLRFFSFPFLHEGDTPEKLQAMRKYLAGSGQRHLPATVGGVDWKLEEPWVKARRAGDREALARIGAEYQATVQAAVHQAEERGERVFRRPVPQVLLLHATEVGAAQWDELFAGLAAAGYRFATADEVFADPAFAEAHAYVGPHGPGLWDRLLAERRAREARKAVETLLATQQAAWNRGDVEAFATAYADDVLFVTPTGETRGRQAVIERYKKRYPDAKAMGTLALEVVEVRLASGAEGATVVGDVVGPVDGVSVAARWKLTGPGREPAQGMTLLVLRNTGDLWEIVQDASM